MPKISKVLVPVDFSPPSRSALVVAAQLSARLGAALDVVHVWEPPHLIRPDLMVWLETNGKAENLAEYSRRQALRDLEQLVGELEDEVRAKTTARVVIGHPASRIVEAAEQGGHDLVITGTHGRTGAAHLFLGSVAERVVRLAPCPVLTVPTAREE